MKKCEWKTIDKDYHQFLLPAIEDVDFLDSLVCFWTLFLRDILPKNPHFKWDHVKFHLEAADDRFTCFPHTNSQLDSEHYRDPNEILARAWASVQVKNWSVSLRRQREISGKEAADYLINQYVVEKICAAAALAKSPPELLLHTLELRFHIYDDEKAFNIKDVNF